jgi:hypothetical protein
VTPPANIGVQYLVSNEFRRLLSAQSHSERRLSESCAW